MNIRDLLTIQPGDIDLSHITLKDGRKLLDVINDVSPHDKTISVLTAEMLRKYVDMLSEEQQAILLNYTLNPSHGYDSVAEEVVSTENAALILESIQARKTGPFARDVQGAIVTYGMLIGCLAMITDIIYISVVTRTYPNDMLSLVILGYIGLISWWHMGVINKERKDLLSVLVGDSKDAGFISSIFGGLSKLRRNRKK